MDLLTRLLLIDHNHKLSNMRSDFNGLCQVYGETSFELIEQMTKVIPFTEDDFFIDLGSGLCSCNTIHIVLHYLLLIYELSHSKLMILNWYQQYLSAEWSVSMWN